MKHGRLNFNRRIIKPQQLLYTPLEIQKRAILAKLRDSKTRGLDSTWQEEESKRMYKSKKLKEKKERIEATKKAKALSRIATVEQKKIRREKERSMQQHSVQIRRALKVARIEEGRKEKFMKYNASMFQTVVGRVSSWPSHPSEIVKCCMRHRGLV